MEMVEVSIDAKSHLKRVVVAHLVQDLDLH